MSIVTSIMRLAMYRSKRNEPDSLWDSMTEDERRIMLTVMRVPEQNSSLFYVNLNRYAKERFTKVLKENG